MISLCVLSYKRPDMLKECLRSLWMTKSYRMQIIVNSDGGDQVNRKFLLDELAANRISTLILNNGENRGVGRAFQNCLGIAEGDIIVKCDSDLVFLTGWQDTVIRIFDKNPDVGAVSLFNYRHYDPNDTRFEIIEQRPECDIVNDFVSSVYAFRAKDLDKIQPVSDDGNHTKLGKLAITNDDMVKNQGFGVGKSVYVSGTVEHPFKTPTTDLPLLV